jgi:hypothetical protein
MKKETSIRIHAARRCVQRKGFVLSKRIHNGLVSVIKRNEAKFIRRQSNRVTVWEVIFEDINYRVVYDKNRKLIVTVLK